MEGRKMLRITGFTILLGLIQPCLGAQTMTQQRVPSKGLTITAVSTPVMLGEGPHWDENEEALYFVDIKEHKINRLLPLNGVQTQATLVGSSADLIIPVEGRPGKFFVAVDLNITEVSWDGENVEGFLSGKSLVSVNQDKPDNRFNDGKADPSGRLWAGTMGPEPVVGEVIPKQGSLFTFEVSNSGNVRETTHLTDIDISNGLAWAADNSTMYYIDTGTDRIDAFDFDITDAKIKNRRPVFDFHDNAISGHPDGMTIDRDGNLWVACFGGSQVIKVDPREGTLLGSVQLPAERVTSVVFGGPNLDILYVTTSRFGLTYEQLVRLPQAGSVFAITGLGVQGFPSKKAKPLTMI